MNERDDLDLQRHLGGDSDVHRAYQSLPGEAPPPALDAAILAAARSEAARPVRPAWFLPLSVAATIVLGVGLTVQLLRPPAPRVHDGFGGEAAAPMADALTSDAAADGPDAPAGVNALAEAARQVALERDGGRRLQDAVPPAEVDAGLSQIRERREQEPPRAQVGAAPQPPAQAATTGSQPPAAAPEEGFAAAPPARAADSAPRRQAKSVGPAIAPGAPGLDERRDARAPLAASAPPASEVLDDDVAARPMPNAADAPAANAADSVVSDFAMAQGGAAPMSAKPAASPLEEVLLTGARPKADDEDGPRAELDEIRKLYDAGQRREAWRRFRIFLKDYPDYEIPKDFPYERR